MEFNEPKNLAPPQVENQEACDHYQPIGTGDCWACGHPFHEHHRQPICVGCCVDALMAAKAGQPLLHTCGKEE